MAKKLYLQAIFISPCKREWNARTPPHPGQGSPVKFINGHKVKVCLVLEDKQKKRMAMPRKRKGKFPRYRYRIEALVAQRKEKEAEVFFVWPS